MLSILRSHSITATIIKLNVGIFIIFNGFIQLFNPQLFLELSFTFGLVPQIFLSGFLWQPITSAFLHGGLLHIFINMYSLYSIGPSLENHMGMKKFAQLYVVSFLSSALAVILIQANTKIPTVGASGSLAGLLGAIAILTPNSRLIFFIFPVKARSLAFGLAGVSFLLGIGDSASMISHWGHLGGLLGGLAFTYLTYKTPRFKKFRAKKTNPHSEDAETRQVKEKVAKFDPETGEYYYELR